MYIVSEIKNYLMEVKMKGGTYHRALDTGFNKDQASFFADLSMDTKSEAVIMVKSELSEYLESRKLRKRLAKWLHYLANMAES